MANISSSTTNVTIWGSSDLQMLRRSAISLRGRKVIEIPSVVGPDRFYWERRLMKHRNACGCTAGATSMLVSLAVFVGLIFSQGDLFLKRPITLTMLGALVVFASTIFGKFGGLLYRRVLFLAAIAELQRRLTENEQGSLSARTPGRPPNHNHNELHSEEAVDAGFDFFDV